MSQTCIIFNERSGSAERVEQLRQQFEQYPSTKFWPIRDSDASLLARRAVEQGFDRIVAAGGDGTIVAVLNGIAPDFDRVEFAVLPLGTGNDLARSLGYTHDQIELALEACCEAPSRRMDVVRLEVLAREPLENSDASTSPLAKDSDTFYFANAASGGFGGEVAADIAGQDKKRWGALSYWMTAVANLADLHEHEVVLQLDDQRVETNAYGIAIANGRYVGGGFCISHTGILNDGLLNVTVIPVLPALELMSAGVSFAMGGKNPHADILNYLVRRVEIRSKPRMAFSIDGEICGRMDFACEVLPGALRIVAADTSPVFQGLDGTSAETLS